MDQIRGFFHYSWNWSSQNYGNPLVHKVRWSGQIYFQSQKWMFSWIMYFFLPVWFSESHSFLTVIREALGASHLSSAFFNSWWHVSNWQRDTRMTFKRDCEQGFGDLPPCEWGQLQQLKNCFKWRSQQPHFFLNKMVKRMPQCIHITDYKTKGLSITWYLASCKLQYSLDFCYLLHI